MGWFESTARSEAQIEAEIADEIEFHLEQRTRELVEQGRSEQDARAEAERRFGSVERVRESCRWVQLGERIMLQRIQVGLNLVLVVAVVALGWSFWNSNQSMREQMHRLSALLEPRAAELSVQAAAAPDPLRARFAALADPQAAAALANELLGDSPEAARENLRDGWYSVRDPKLRIALLAPFLGGGGHGEAIEILDLGATDPDTSVREEAFRHLKSYAWQDFSGKPLSLYQEWHERVRGTGVVNTLRVSVMGYQARLGLLRGAPLIQELGLLEQIDLAPGSLRGYDALDELWIVGAGNARDLAQRWLASDDAELQLAALRFVGHFRLEAGFLANSVANALNAQAWKSSVHTLAACRVIAAGEQVNLEAYSYLSLRLLRLCVEEDTPEFRQVVGAGVLARLWQLGPDPERGAAQWIAWWQENRGEVKPSKLLESEDARWLDAH